MSRFLEWRLRLGPLGFGVGFRSIDLSDALPESRASTLPAADGLAVGEIRLVGEEPEDERPISRSAGDEP